MTLNKPLALRSALEVEKNLMLLRFLLLPELWGLLWEAECREVSTVSRVARPDISSVWE